MKTLEAFKLGRATISDLTGESLSVIDDAFRAGHLKSFLVGRRRFSRPADVAKWIDFLEAESAAGRPVCYRKRRPEAGDIRTGHTRKAKA